MDYKLSRLTEYKSGKLSGAMSPMLFAQEIAKSVDESLIAIYRVWFDGDNLYQEFESGEGWTGFDHVIICFPHWVVFSVDKGCSGQNVAACFGMAENDFNIKANEGFKYMLSEDELKKLLRQGYNTAMQYKQELYKQMQEDKMP